MSTIQERFDFYCRCWDVIQFSPHPMVLHQYEEKGISPAKAFDEFFSRGKIVGTSDPDAVNKARRGMAALNWQIKQWSEEIKARRLFGFELIESFPWMPDWVWEAVKKQSGLEPIKIIVTMMPIAP